MPPATKPERTPEVMAQLKLEQQTNHVNLLVGWGETEKAKKYWISKRGDTLPFPKSLQDALTPAPAEMITVDEAPTPEEPAKPDTSPSGWPLRTTGEIIRKCVNKRLVVIRLANNRIASMWNTGVRPWKVGARVSVKLEKMEGDPIYRTY